MPDMQPTAFFRCIRFRKACLAWASLPLLIASSWAAQPTDAQKRASAKAKAETKLDTKNLVVAPDLATEVAKFKPVRMPFDSSKLTPRERQMVAKLVEACQYLESIYWRQSDPEGLKLYHALDGSTAPRDILLRRYLRINGAWEGHILLATTLEEWAASGR